MAHVPQTIVLCANTSWYLKNFRSSTILWLKSSGWSVLCLCSDDEHKDYLVSIGASVSRVRLSSNSTNPYLEIIAFFSFYRHFRNKPAVVLNFTPKCNIFASLAAKFASRQTLVVNNISGMGSGSTSNLLVSAIVHILYRVCSRAADFTFLQNNEDLSFFVKRLGLPPTRARLLPGSGVNLIQFPFEPMPASKVIRFGMFSRIIREKGVFEFAEAARKVKLKYEAEFILAGKFDLGRADSITREHIRAFEESGALSYMDSLSDVQFEMARCHCVVLPSYYAEGTPKSLLEAAATGRPIITTDNKGCRDTVVDGMSGILVCPRSVESLTEAMIRIVELDESERAQMGCASRRHAEEHFDERNVICEYCKVISGVDANRCAVCPVALSRNPPH